MRALLAARLQGHETCEAVCVCIGWYSMIDYTLPCDAWSWPEERSKADVVGQQAAVSSWFPPKLSRGLNSARLKIERGKKVFVEAKQGLSL